MPNATENLYSAFRHYPLKPEIEGCPHCELGNVDASLHGRPLRKLRWKDFGVYLFKAMTTFGDSDDFKHFLPRLFELYVVDHMGAPYGVATLFAKLEYAGWASWPSAEREAIRSFVRVWLHDLEASVLQSSAEPWQLEELRSALSHSRFDTGSAV